MDVEQLPTHGGSLRVWLAHNNTSTISSSVEKVLAEELLAGLETVASYADFQQRAESAKMVCWNMLQSKRQGRRVLGYGAAAKGNTLLNYAGIRSDLLPFVADRAPSKQGKYLPGSHIPVISPELLAAETYDSLLVLPWNLLDEVRKQFPDKELVTAIPDDNLTSRLLTSCGVHLEIYL